MTSLPSLFQSCSLMLLGLHVAINMMDVLVIKSRHNAVKVTVLYRIMSVFPNTHLASLYAAVYLHVST